MNRHTNSYLKISILFLSIVFLHQSMQSQTIYNKSDIAIYNRYIQQFEPQSKTPIPYLMVQTALSFKDAPYTASTLDNGENEKLVINLQTFDCTTFVETCIALVQTLKAENKQFSTFANNLQKLRYRNDDSSNYTSRLHYVSDWSYTNAKKNILSDITKTLGGTLNTKQINFMSTHPDAYKALKDNRKTQQKIKEVEDRINQRGGFYVLPKNKIKKAEQSIANGNIIAFATTIEGLDYSHIGIAYYEDNKLTFIHASTRTMSVIVEQRSLNQYCQQSPKCTGISIFQLK